MPVSEKDAVNYLHQIFDAGVSAVIPAPIIQKYLPEPPAGKCVVVGAGKASAAMAASVNTAWAHVDLSGVVSTRYGHAVNAGRIKIIEAGHPVPDEASEQSAKEILNAVQGLTENDMVLALISGGGSANLALPIDGLTLTEKQAVTKALLKSGAGIEEMNIVRQQLSKIKGGGLAAAVGKAKLVTLLISDIPGDKIESIASGPTVASTGSGDEALEILDRYNIDIPSEVKAQLKGRPPKNINAENHEHKLIASPAIALNASAKKARSLGFNPLILGDAIECESAELGKAMAGIAQSVKSMAQPIASPAAIISGGETGVTIGKDGAGRGGRNTEFALSMALTLKGEENIYALAGDSDGIDGTEDAAGAFITPNTLSDAKAKGLNTRSYLSKHDSYSLFDEIGALVKTGPTLTNVNDIRVVLVF